MPNAAATMAARLSIAPKEDRTFSSALAIEFQKCNLWQFDLDVRKTQDSRHSHCSFGWQLRPEDARRG